MINVRNRKRIRITLALATVAAVWLDVSTATAQTPGIARVQGGNTKTIWGVGFTPEAQVWGWNAPFDMNAVLAAIEADDYARGAGLPAEPPEGARQFDVLSRDERGLVMAVAFHDRYGGSGFFDAMPSPRVPAEVVWVENEEGFSSPWQVLSAQPWFVYPERAEAGERVRVFGRNLTFRNHHQPDEVLVVLRSRDDGSVTRVEHLDRRRGQHSRVRHAMYEIAMRLPSNLSPGEYDLHVHNGAGGEAGWSEALTLTVTQPANANSTVFDVRDFGASGDGVTDDTAALREALAAAGERGDGVVHLPPGRYAIRETLEVPEGVSLRGAGMHNSAIVVRDENPMRGDFPDDAELEGFARDWLPHMRGHGYPPMVWLRHRSALSDLTLRSGRGVGMGVLIARCPGVAKNIRIERARLIVDNATNNWPNAVPVLLAGNTYGLVLRDNEMGGNGSMSTIAPMHEQAYVGGNVMQVNRIGRNNNFFIRGFERSVIEDNIMRNADRNFASQLGRTLGIHETPEGKRPPSRRSVHVAVMGNLWRNNLPRRHNAGENMYETGSAYWHGRAAQVDSDRLRVDGAPFWTDMSGNMVLVLGGRGIGQYRWIVESTEDELILDRPWDVVPDEETYLMVGGGAVEHLWIDNTEEHTANWTGFWGNNIGHVVDGHIQRGGQGLYLWAYNRTNPSPVAFVDFIGSRTINRGNFVLRGPLVFGNTIRTSEAVGFRYRPDFHIQPTWLPHARGAEGMNKRKRAGLSIEGHHRGAHEIKGLPATAPLRAWNVVEGMHLYDGPRGVFVSEGSRHNIFRVNTIDVDGEAIVDQGQDNLFIDNNVFTQDPAYE